MRSHNSRARMKSIFVTPLALSLLSLASAQPSADPTFRASLIQAWSANYSFSGEAALAHGSQEAQVSVHAASLSVSGRRPLSPTCMVAYGLAHSRYDFDHSSSLAIPDSLGELSLNLGLVYRPRTNWSYALYARPGFYSDLKTLRTEALNLPLLFLTTFRASDTLSWSFGARLDPFAENSLLPLLGLNWKVSPAWTFNLGFPRAGLTFKASEACALFAGLSVQGGSFRLGENVPAATSPTSSFAGQRVEYREIRTGLGADWRIHKALKLTTEIGVMLDRRLEYYKIDYALSGDAAVYFSLGLSSAF